MRLSAIESVVRAVLLLLPAIAALVGASVVWVPSKFPEISERRAATFRSGLILAGLSTALFVVASADQLRTRQLLPGFWTVMNACAAVAALLGFAAAFTGRGWARILMLGWGALLVIGMLAVVVTTIP